MELVKNTIVVFRNAPQTLTHGFTCRAYMSHSWHVFAIAILDHRLENLAIVHAKCGAKLNMKQGKMSAYEIIILREHLTAQ